MRGNRVSSERKNAQRHFCCGIFVVEIFAVAERQGCNALDTSLFDGEAVATWELCSLGELYYVQIVIEQSFFLPLYELCVCISNQFIIKLKTTLC